MIKRGFPNLPIIKLAVRQLYRTISPKVLRTYRYGYSAYSKERPQGDAIIATQEIARWIAALYRLQVGSIIVSFVSHLERPGQIELSDSNDFFIELHSRYRHRYEQVAAILAHEVAHIVCHRLGMRLGTTFEDEVLTDTTAAYLGAGVPILNAFTEESAFTLESISDSGKPAPNPNEFLRISFGYITPEEFGYLLAKRHGALGDDPGPLLTSKLGIEAYKIGSRRARQEQLRAPLISATVRSRAAYRVKRYLATRTKLSQRSPTVSESVCTDAYEFDTAVGSSVLFDCPTCFQRLRLPTDRERISVRCPACHERFVCAT